ncbi:UNVERIFIED_ORG: hypothetical protein ABIB19_003805 [Arthrobacter sp. UYEF10]
MERWVAMRCYFAVGPAPFRDSYPVLEAGSYTKSGYQHSFVLLAAAGAVAAKRQGIARQGAAYR